MVVSIIAAILRGMCPNTPTRSPDSATLHAMNIPLHTAVAATALVWGSILFASAALAQTDQQRKLALAAHDQSVLKKRPAPMRVSPARSLEHAKSVQAQFDKLCTFYPVMSDAQIDGCKQAHKL
jgi:hypothetical protein